MTSGDLADHYHIGRTQDNWVVLSELVKKHPDDPAFSVRGRKAEPHAGIPDCGIHWEQTFIEDLQNHVLGRLTGRPFDGEESTFSVEDRYSLIIAANKLYRHAYLRVNYTTYDIRRDTDVVNPSVPSRSFIMVNSSAGKHPFWYARVLGIYHIQVLSAARGILNPKRIDFLHVRWLGDEPGAAGGIPQKRLHRVGYVSPKQGAFGFIDPAMIVRGCFLIPAFRLGRSTSLLPKSVAWDSSEEGDWAGYYVNM